MTVRTVDVRFNYELQVHNIFITDKPVIQIVYVATHSVEAGLLRSQSTIADDKKFMVTSILGTTRHNGI